MPSFAITPPSDPSDFSLFLIDRHHINASAIEQ